MDIIIISARPDYWQKFLPFFAERSISVHQADHPDYVADIIGQTPAGQFELVIIDLPHTFDSLLAYAREVLALRPESPGLAVAATSALPDYSFAKAAANLRLFPLPVNIKTADLEKLLEISRLPRWIPPGGPETLQ